MSRHCQRSEGRSFAPVRRWSLALIAVAGVTAACVSQNPPTDVGNPVAATSTTTSSPQPAPTPSTQPLSYDQDMKPIFLSDCVVCHSGSRPSAGYAMDTYARVMVDVQPGNPNSRLVLWTQPGGTMYRFWTGNAAQKAAMVKQWVVTYNAQQSR